MAAWAYAESRHGGSAATAKDFVAKLYKNVPVLDSGARGSTTTFVERGIGDVEIAWENDALLAVNKLGKGRFEIVRPSLSILAEPPVALVDAIVAKRGTRAVAQAYLDFLYSPTGQDIIARHYFRPRLASVAKRYADQFPAMKLVDIDRFGGWRKAQQEYFADGGVFDQIYQSESIARAQEHNPGLRPDARLHALLSLPDRAAAAGRDVRADVEDRLARVLAYRNGAARASGVRA